jgi:hypothetical protein
MLMNRWNRCVAGALLLFVVAVPPPAAATAERSGSLAWFEDHWIDLAVDWEDATACDVRPTGTVCFRTEKEMNTAARHAAASAQVGTMSMCGSSLRLYDGISYTGTVLALGTRGVPINLSGYGFDNITTSYKVGGCDTEFYSAPNLGGSSYPGITSAGAQSATMAAGWNNLVSSVYIS